MNKSDTDIKQKHDDSLGESLGDTGEKLHRFEFPEDIYRVTAGKGGESLLIDGGSEIAIYDCGMAYCHEGLIKNIESKLTELGHDNLDKIILSHSHYDHMGALPYLLHKWPEAKVVGGAKLQKVFSSDRARATMKRLGEAARDKYLPEEASKPMDERMEILVDGLRVDRTIADGDLIKVGKYELLAIQTPGHTDCSFSYMIQGNKILFASESVGVLENEHHIHTSMLKSYEGTIESAIKCKSLKPEVIISSHYGVVPENTKDGYFDLYIEAANKEKDFILDRYDEGLELNEIYDKYEDEYFSLSRVGAQPVEAFKENAYITIKLIIREFRDSEYGK